MSYRELGLLSIIISWAAFAFLLTKWRGKRSMSISLHAASARSAYYFFAAMQIISGYFLTLFMFHWFIPELQLDLGFQVIFFLTAICFYATILIPDLKKVLFRKLHRIFAFSMAFLLAVNVFYILTTCNLSLATQLIGGATLAYMLFCQVTYVRFRKSPEHFIMSHYLPFQVLYLVFFQIFILAATYLS